MMLGRELAPRWYHARRLCACVCVRVRIAYIWTKGLCSVVKRRLAKDINSSCVSSTSQQDLHCISPIFVAPLRSNVQRCLPKVVDRINLRPARAGTVKRAHVSAIVRMRIRVSLHECARSRHHEHVRACATSRARAAVSASLSTSHAGTYPDPSSARIVPGLPTSAATCKALVPPSSTSTDKASGNLQRRTCAQWKAWPRS